MPDGSIRSIQGFLIARLYSFASTDSPRDGSMTDIVSFACYATSALSFSGKESFTASDDSSSFTGSKELGD